MTPATEARRALFELLKRLDRRDLMLLRWLAHNVPDGAWRSAADVRSETRWTLPTATCVLSKLRNFALAETTTEMGRRSRLYRITKLGHQVLGLDADLRGLERVA